MADCINYFVIARTEDWQHHFAKTDHAIRINHHHATARAEDRFHFIGANNHPLGIGKQPEFIEIKGKTYDLTTYNSEIEGTRITEVQ